MKKWIGPGLLLAALLLTGCGRGDKLAQYIKPGDFGMINTEEEAKACNAKLNREKKMKWVYDTDKINQMLELDKLVRTAAKEEDCVTDTDSFVGRGDVRVWKKHAEAGSDPASETLRFPSIYIEGKSKESIKNICTQLEKAGYDGVSGCLECKKIDGEVEENLVICQGIQFMYEEDDGEDYDDDYDDEDYEDEEDGLEEAGEESDQSHVKDMEKYYTLVISIADSICIYPEKYKDILTLLQQNKYYVRQIECYGGEVNRITAQNVDAGAWFAEVKILLDQEGNLLDLQFFTEKEPASRIQLDTERTILVELLTRMNGEKNASSVFVNHLSPKNGGGMVTDNCSWSIRSIWMEDDVKVLQFRIY